MRDEDGLVNTANGSRVTDHDLPGARITPFTLLLLATLCGGCQTPAFLEDLTSTSSHGSGFTNTNIFGEGQTVTYEHPFTDAAAENVRKSAERHCAQRKLAAAKTGGTCTLTRCTAHYQCMKAEEAAAYQQPRK